RRMLAFPLEKEQAIAPQVLLSVHDGGVEPAAHGRRACDGVSARRLADLDFDVDHGLGPVTCRRDAGVFKRRAGFFAFGLGGADRLGNEDAAHEVSWRERAESLWLSRYSYRPIP